MKQVVSLDLWKTLIKVAPENMHFLTAFLSQHSPLPESSIVEQVKLMGSHFDNIAIKSGLECASNIKLKALIDNVEAKLDVDVLSSAIKHNILETPPVIIDPQGFKLLSDYLHSHSLGFVIASNSGFLNSEIMLGILEKLQISSMDSYCESFFSDQITFAKPSLKFFEPIMSKYTILCHCGDTIEADYNIVSPDFTCVLFDPSGAHPECKHVKKIDELSTYLDQRRSTP